jgi:hypothetical protein
MGASLVLAFIARIANVASTGGGANRMVELGTKLGALASSGNRFSIRRGWSRV